MKKSFSTKKQFKTLSDLYDYYNFELFGGELNDCMLNLSRHRGAAGFFINSYWKSATGQNTKHEISINPDTLNIGDEYWHSTLVHEMCHLWQYDFGKPSRYGYHNKQWAKKMIEVGLMPTDTGKEGGKITGQNMSDYPIEGGLFQKAFKKINSQELQDLLLPYTINRASRQITYVETDEEAGAEQVKESKSGVKKKYSCQCGNNVWGKSGLNISCLECEQPFLED